MSSLAAAVPSSPERSLFRRLARISAGLVLLVLLAVTLNSVSWHLHGVTVLWLPNGLLIGALVCMPRREWAPYFAVFAGLDVLTNFALHETPITACVLTSCNLVEVLVAARCCYPALHAKPDLTEGRQLRAFLLYAVLLAPAIASSLASLYLRLHAGVPFAGSVRIWFAADLLGIATVTPLYLSFARGRLLFARSAAETAALFLLLCTVAAAVFGVATIPALWLVQLTLLLLGVRLGFSASALGLLIVACIGGYFTVTGRGPLTVVPGGLHARILLFQLFIAASMLALYVTEVAMAGNRRMRLILEASETRFRLLTEASRDVIVLADLHARHQYVSPAATELLGWHPNDLLGARFHDKIHPADLPAIEGQLAAVLADEPTSPLAFRSRKRDGAYLWLEATVRLVRDPQTDHPSGFVYVLRDIAYRKAAEEELQRAVRAAERLAMMDGLTGVANRRLLDQVLTQEWLRAFREDRPISLLLIDVDHFKRYNDLYGHLAGDSCLRLIAELIQSVLKRPSDLLARYGGEEFVVVLPNTDLSGAVLVASEIRHLIQERAVTHGSNPFGVVTVSIGCAGEIPAPGVPVSNLLEAADSALYRAKSGGRNRLHAAQSTPLHLPLS